MCGLAIPLVDEDANTACLGDPKAGGRAQRPLQFHSGSNLHAHVRFSQLCQAGCDTATWTHVTLPVGLRGHREDHSLPGPRVWQRSLALLDRLGVSEGLASLPETESHPSGLSLSIF